MANENASAAADISAFLAEAGNSPADDPETPETLVDAEQTPENETEGDSTEGSEADAAPTDDAEVKPAAATVDTKALLAAIEAKDPAAFLEALGSAADAVLTGKAHTVLRLQLKDAKAAKQAAEASQTQAKDLTNKLAAKYGDPIDARKAAEAGDVDAFVDMVEKWGGHSWNDLMKWVAKGMAGKPERLAAKQREETQTVATQTIQQAKALDETKTWVSSAIRKADAKIMTECPEVVDLVISEIKSGLAKGVDSPAKALPLVKAKLKENYERLGKYFAANGAKKAKAPVPAARVGKREVTNGRPMTMAEEIAEFTRAEGLSR